MVRVPLERAGTVEPSGLIEARQMLYCIVSYRYIQIDIGGFKDGFNICSPQVHHANSRPFSTRLIFATKAAMSSFSSNAEDEQGEGDSNLDYTKSHRLVASSGGAIDPFDQARLLEYTNDELLEHINAAPLAPCSSATMLSTETVAKSTQWRYKTDELAAQQLALKIGIRTPQIQRTIDCEDCVYILMERIRGRTLEAAWLSLGWFQTLGLALQLRRFVRIMSTQRSCTAGGLSSGLCNSIWMDDIFNES